MAAKENNFSKYVDYLLNAGGSLKVEWFDDDWEPVGPMLRKEMEAEGLITVSDDQKIHLLRR